LAITQKLAKGDKRIIGQVIMDVLGFDGEPIDWSEGDRQRQSEAWHEKHGRGRSS